MAVKKPPPLTHDQYEKLINIIQGLNINQQFRIVTSNQIRSIQSSDHISTDNKGIQIVNTLSCNNFFFQNLKFCSWIIDLGASHHKCSSLHWFHSYSETTSMTIKLSNGHHAITKYIGTVVFFPGFLIMNVLYDPGFIVNLIYVSALCQSLNCLVSFDGLKCFI